MSSDKVLKGRLGEEEAVKVLRKNGYRILERNFRTRYGEIDLIARDGDTIVFVEVRTKGTTLFGQPSSSIDRAKISRITKTSNIFLSQRGLFERPARFDVVSIEKRKEGISLELIKNAFEAIED